MSLALSRASAAKTRCFAVFSSSSSFLRAGVFLFMNKVPFSEQNAGQICGSVHRSRFARLEVLLVFTHAGIYGFMRAKNAQGGEVRQIFHQLAAPMPDNNFHPWVAATRGL